MNRGMVLALDGRGATALVLSRPFGVARRRFTIRQVLSLMLLALLVATGTVATRSAVAGLGPHRKVIIRTLPGHEQAVEREVSGLGGRVETQLPIIHGFSATIPEAALEALAKDEAVLAVTLNGRVSLTGSYDPSNDSYSMQNVDRSVRATRMWEAGYTGAGVDIALIDSGVAPVEGLSVPGKIIHGPDLSLESQALNLRHLDTYGHGTHMAGIMAGRDGAATPGTYSTDTTHFLGVAPDARIISIKVADYHGNADVSQVIAAIDWVVQHAHDPGLNIEVLNLSFGTASNQIYVLDPLAFAAETAWHRGITVVAAVGNSGRDATGLADPAADPYLLAVGAADHHGSMQYSQWDVADFSQIGDGIRNPDILAPGAHIQSLRVPGSYVDRKYHGGRIDERFFRGSGSSQATAVVSGALALLFQEYPSMTPDQAKALLKTHANGLRPSSGFGPRQGQRALRLDTALLGPVPLAQQVHLQSTGLGTLEGSRGPVHLVRDGLPLQGEQDIFGAHFDAAAMAALEAAANSWSGGTWNGNQWTGNEWSGNEWSGNEWSSGAWASASWS
ncbi:MAG TPA: S8 family serine peptidase [Actinomycetota bacterium]|nr:S8 family serine peptidase [Actinomycetota bacterium]